MSVNNGILSFLQDKSVLILGFGREGKSTYEYLKKILPGKKIAIADKVKPELNDENIMLITGDDYLKSISLFDVVIKSPGISVRDVEISPSVTVTCQLDLFMRYAPCTKIGITGTKGKTTTSTLIFDILKAAGLKTCLIGNIGIPVFDVIDSCEGYTAVIEMSSHQLEFTSVSPHIAVVTNIYPEHLDHYNGFEGYVKAKSNIAAHQTKDDYLICNADQDLFEYFDKTKTESKIVRVGIDDDDEFLKSISHINPHLLGRHNIHDIYYAANVARISGVSDGDIKRGIESFEGIPHRMEYVGCFEGITFYNDSIATVPTAVMLAVEALETVNTLIIGGMDRGLSYSDFEKSLIESNIKNIICLPETGTMIGRDLEKSSDKNIIFVNEMSEAVDAAYKVTEKGHICLMSPAAASYNRFKNFEEKGNCFKDCVKNHK